MKIESYKFDSDNVTCLNIGRNEDCDIKLNFDKTYSKYQCSINWDKQKKVWYISDGINGKFSKNGTWILIGKSIPLLESTNLMLNNNLFEVDLKNEL